MEVIMDETTRIRIRQIFVDPRPSYALMTAAMLLGMGFQELKREIEVGAIVAVSTRLGQRVASEEMIAAAMWAWEQAGIEEALGDEAGAGLAEAIRLGGRWARGRRGRRGRVSWVGREGWKDEE